MEHRVKVTVIDKKLYPELQALYCAVPDEGCLQSPGTKHCGTKGVPFCSEAWDCISRYIYAALQGGAIMHGWTNDDKVMIACCNDGTRPVIFKIERIDTEN